MDSTVDHPNIARKKRLIIIISLIFPIILIFFLVKYRIEAPVEMQWELAPLIDKAYTGTLSLRDLWELHNEHRPIFSRALLVYLAQITHWTVLYELLANVVCASITFFSLLHLLKKTEIQFGKTLIGIIPIISLIIFSLNQSENWFGGFNIQIFMNVAAVTLGIVLLSVSEPNWAKTLVAASLGIIATYTFANGLLFWPLGIWILWKKKASWKLIILWVVVTAIAVLFYFPGYQKPAHHPSPWSFLASPVQALNYIFAYIGAPVLAFCKKSHEVAEMFSEKGWIDLSKAIRTFQNAASFAGLVGIGIFVYMYRRLSSSGKNGTLIAFLALSGYSILSAVMSAFGRSAMGIENALSLRYITISSLFWISLLVFLRLSQVTPAPKKNGLTNFSIAAIVFLFVLNSIYGALYSIKLHAYLMPGRAELYRMQDDQLLQRLLGDTAYIRHNLPILKKYQLSVFKKEENRR
jgi:hypothetical protein